MADKKYIERENYCKNICCCNYQACDKSKCPIWTAPAADVAPIVRCTDCKYYCWVQEPSHGKPLRYCQLHSIQVRQNDFCNHGAKMDNTEPATNYDRNYDILCTLSQEEMADELLKAEWCDSSCAYGSDMKAEQCKECMLKWLNSKRKDDKK